MLSSVCKNEHIDQKARSLDRAFCLHKNLQITLLNDTLETIMTKVEIQKLDHSEIELTGSIPAEVFDANRAQAISNLGKDIELQGFRKGHVPENLLVKHIGEHHILEEMAEITIGKEYRTIVIENNIDPIGRPEVSITKMALGNPLEFKIKVAVMPQVTLGDYKKAAAEANNKKIAVDVTDADVEETVTEIRNMYGKHNHTHAEGEEHTEGEEIPLPEFNDEFVKQLGDFSNVDDFKAKLRENIRLEKEHKEEDKRRFEMMEKITNDASIDLPRIIVEAELNKMIAEFRTDVERMGMSFDTYLEHSKKTEEDVRKDLEKEAERKAKYQLVLNKIAQEEKIVADHDEVHAQIDALMKQYPNANKNSVHVYVESNIVNKKVFEFLGTQK